MRLLERILNWRQPQTFRIELDQPMEVVFSGSDFTVSGRLAGGACEGAVSWYSYQSPMKCGVVSTGADGVFHFTVPIDIYEDIENLITLTAKNRDGETASNGIVIRKS